TPTTSSSGSTDDAAPVIYDAITNLLGLLSDTPAPQPMTVTAPGLESSSAPTTQPTGTPQFLPIIR
ncbi:hypothetical protein BJV77DRAFT_971634, partial [Russula vinacea]